MQCSFGNVALTFPNVADTVTGLTLAASGSPAGCDVSKNYEQLTFAKCAQSEPDATNKYHMEVWEYFSLFNLRAFLFHPEAITTAKKVTINNDGYFKIEFTALLTSTDNKITRVEVYKVTSKDPTNSCGAITSACTTLIQLRFNSKVFK